MSPVSVDQRSFGVVKEQNETLSSTHPGEEGLAVFPSRQSIPSCSSLNRENSTGIELPRIPPLVHAHGSAEVA